MSIIDAKRKDSGKTLRLRIKEWGKVDKNAFHRVANFVRKKVSGTKLSGNYKNDLFEEYFFWRVELHHHRWMEIWRLIIRKSISAQMMSLITRTRTSSDDEYDAQRRFSSDVIKRMLFIGDALNCSRKLFYALFIRSWMVLEPWTMGVHRGGQERALPTPWSAKIVCFSTFREEKYLIRRFSGN